MVMKASWSAAVVFIASLAGAALAQDGGSDDAKARAQALVDEAFEQITAGDHQGAVATFREAYAIYPSEAILLNIGTALLELGNVAGAAQAYRGYLDHSDASEPRRARVEAELARLEARVARLKLEISVPGVALSIDGVALEVPKGTEVIFVEPGRRTISAKKPGFKSVAVTVEAQRGAQHVVHIVLEKEPAPDPPAPDPPETRKPAVAISAAPVEPPDGRSRAPWIVVGGGAVVTAAGAGLLAWALADRRAVENVEPGTPLGDLEDRRRRVRPLSIAGIAGIAIGGAAIAGGLTWALWPRGSHTVEVGPGHVAVRGSF